MISSVMYYLAERRRQNCTDNFHCLLSSVREMFQGASYHVELAFLQSCQFFEHALDLPVIKNVEEKKAHCKNTEEMPNSLGCDKKLFIRGSTGSHLYFKLILMNYFCNNKRSKLVY